MGPILGIIFMVIAGAVVGGLTKGSMRGKSVLFHTAVAWCFFLYVAALVATSTYKRGWQGFLLAWLVGGSAAIALLYDNYTKKMYPDWRSAVPWNRLLWGIILSAGLGPFAMLSVRYSRIYQRLGFDPPPWSLL